MITETAIHNIKILKEKYSNGLSLINDNNKLSLIEKDNFDTMCKTSSLEYPIYFTYNHLLDIIAYDKSISYRSKKYLLEMMEESFDNLVDYIDDYDEDNDILNQLLTDIYEKYDLIESKTLYGSKIENMIYFFDELVDAFKTAKKYLYFSPCSYYPLINVEPGDFVNDDNCCSYISNQDSESDSSEVSDDEPIEESGSDDEREKLD